MLFSTTSTCWTGTCIVDVRSMISKLTIIWGQQQLRRTTGGSEVSIGSNTMKQEYPTTCVRCTTLRQIVKQPSSCQYEGIRCWDIDDRGRRDENKSLFTDQDRQIYSKRPALKHSSSYEHDLQNVISVDIIPHHPLYRRTSTLESILHDFGCCDIVHITQSRLYIITMFIFVIRAHNILYISSHSRHIVVVRYARRTLKSRKQHLARGVEKKE